MARRTHEWTAWLGEASDRSFAVQAPAGFRSPTVTAVTLPDGLNGPAVVRALADRGITIAPGYGKLKDASIRIGHMGDHTPSELEVVLAAVAEVLGVGGPQHAAAVTNGSEGHGVG